MKEVKPRKIASKIFWPLKDLYFGKFYQISHLKTQELPNPDLQLRLHFLFPLFSGYQQCILDHPGVESNNGHCLPLHYKPDYCSEKSWNVIHRNVFQWTTDLLHWKFVSCGGFIIKMNQMSNRNHK